MFNTNVPKFGKAELFLAVLGYTFVLNFLTNFVWTHTSYDLDFLFNLELKCIFRGCTLNPKKLTSEFYKLFI